MSTSRQATAQRSGTRPNRPVSSSVASPRVRARSTAPALHSAAANTTSLLARCRAEIAVHRDRGQLDGELCVAHRGGTIAGRHRQLRGDPRSAYREPVVRRFCHDRCLPDSATSRRRPADRCPARRPPARSTHRRRPRGRHRPVPTRDHPSRGPAGASPADAETRPGCYAPARQADRPAHCQQRREVLTGAAVAALPAGADRAQPQLMRCAADGSGQRPG